MLESIHIGMSGLIGYSQGLRVIANNTANLNTPGFKGATQQFADLFYSGSGAAGHGLDTGATTLSFRQGELRQSANPLDLAIDGLGFLLLRDETGAIRYSRAGQFVFDSAGLLSDRTSQARVMARSANGELATVSLEGYATIAAKPTSQIRLAGNLSSTSGTQAVEGITLIDRLGTQHTLRAVFVNGGAGSGPASAGLAGNWQVQLFENGQLVGSQPLNFRDGRPAPGNQRLAFRYTPAGLDSMALTLDLGSDVTSYASGTLSTLAVTSQDGLAPGSLTGVGFGADGVLRLNYSNGQSIDGARLALARFASEEDVLATGGNRFAATDGARWLDGMAGEEGFGSIRSGTLEISNVDLSQEFSNLVIMQRGYQASSQVISVANDMLQELFSMKGGS